MVKNKNNQGMKARILVKGFVQGVAYRNFVMRNARKLNIFGEVRNLSNGDVEIFCKTKDLKHLNEFIGKINVKNPDDIYSPNVEKIEKYTESKEIEKFNPPKVFNVFEINYGDIPNQNKEMLIKLDTGSSIMKNMHQDMSNSFKRIDEKYDSFGKDLKKLTKCINKFVEHYIDQSSSK